MIVNRAPVLGNPQFALWRPGAPDTTPLLKDLASFYGISLTSDRTRAVSQRTEDRSGIWLGAATGEAMTQVVDDSAAEPSGAAVDNDGAVYYGANLPDGRGAIYRVTPGARSEPALIIEPGANPRLSADGRAIAFVRHEPRQTILRAASDGSHVETLLDALPAMSPALSPDGKTLYFTSTEGGAYTLWSVAVPGGTPRKLGHTGMDVRFAISPDGRTGSFLDASRKGMLCDLPECTNARPSGADAWGSFTPDGRGLAFVPRNDPKNVWVQPFGAPARPLTHFTDKRVINDFSFSRDGRGLIITRSITASDIVMITGLR
ncbi:MAG: hypothetical protein EPO35_06355 [Acidobacteria bacterium]|nr:MAG: hypothetical protein EPO35_06355 [Acidobacteriota bacterium]